MLGTEPIYIEVIDDDGSIGRSLDPLLGAAGLNPIWFWSVETFLDDLRKPPFGYRVPGVAGLDLSRRLVTVRAGLRSRPPPSHDEPTVRSGAMAAGAPASP